ncbi:MAG: hypothetical protein QM726_14630 [Chitinophagaceae bacterium]
MMMKKVGKILLTISICIGSIALKAQVKTNIAVKVDAATGNYNIFSATQKWNWTGSTHRELKHVQQKIGNDSLGQYKAISFEWTGNNLYKGTIRWYNSLSVVLFDLSLPDGATDQSVESFPSFSTVPDSLYHFSYHNRIFPLPQFFLEETSTPWMFFNDNKDACIISPASDFIVSLMTNNGNTQVNSGLNPQVKKLPPHFTHTSIMVIKQGIGNAWDTWGNTLRTMYKRKRPANDADVVLKYFGVWTDVGGDYYYNFDTSKGYDGTLLALKEHYKKEGIPLGYLQLDSWWYQKSYNNVFGKSGGLPKRKDLPEAPWNRSGGLMEYKADPALFPKGLAAFQQELGLPLVTHNRWMDSSSPYHDKYKISGIGAIDPGFWNEVMTYLKSSGVAVYEQDWMNYIYMNNPEMISDINIGNAFTDNMAKAAAEKGLHMQYCMGLPRYFMQGVKYNNLTTIRTAGDRFKQERWMNFLFTSQLAYEMGIWPWSDVFKSKELNNMIVSVMSGGPVGTGDSISTENKANIMMACRNDGVLVKPDRPMLPIDQNYLQLAKTERTPIIAATYTRHNNIQTGYVLAFAGDSTKVSQYHFNLHDVGMQGNCVLFEPLTKTLRLMNNTDEVNTQLPADSFAFYIVAPVTASGIAFLGDAGKIAATGKQRIATIENTATQLKIKVLFAPGEPSVTLQGYCDAPVKTNTGTVSYDKESKLFTVTVSPLGKNNFQNLVLVSEKRKNY